MLGVVIGKIDTKFKLGVNSKLSACVSRHREQPPDVDVNYPDIWLQAIKEVLAEDGQPPLSADDEQKVRADIEQMKAARTAFPERSAVPS